MVCWVTTNSSIDCCVVKEQRFGYKPCSFTSGCCNHICFIEIEGMACWRRMFINLRKRAVPLCCTLVFLQTGLNRLHGLTNALSVAVMTCCRRCRSTCPSVPRGRVALCEIFIPNCAWIRAVLSEILLTYGDTQLTVSAVTVVARLESIARCMNPEE